MTDPYTIEGESGTITITGAALTQLVIAAAEADDGARVRRPRRGPEIAIEDDRARVALELCLPYGTQLPDAARDVQRRVAESLRASCGVSDAVVDVAVEELAE